MKQKTLGVLALSAALLFSAYGEIFVADLSNIREKNTEDPAVSGNTNGGLVSEQDQKIEGMERFDPNVFNTHRAAWEEAGQPNQYGFYQSHSGPGMDMMAVSK
jgi:hypothetical protein